MRLSRLGGGKTSYQDLRLSETRALRKLVNSTVRVSTKCDYFCHVRLDGCGVWPELKRYPAPTGTKTNLWIRCRACGAENALTNKHPASPKLLVTWFGRAYHERVMRMRTNDDHWWAHIYHGHTNARTCVYAFEYS